jgi:hypothetical protein
MRDRERRGKWKEKGRTRNKGNKKNEKAGDRRIDLSLLSGVRCQHITQVACDVKL